MQHTRTNGFTLLELTLVIAIIGILVGGIVAAQDFMRKSDIASSISKVESMVIAYNEFLGQYGQPPGDFTRATNIWGARTAPACPPLPGIGLEGTRTCNGNGDKVIDFGTPESYLAIQHVSLAGLLQGQYTGAAAISGDPSSAQGGVNMPRGGLDNSVLSYRLTNRDGGLYQIGTSGTYWYPGKYGPLIFFGRTQAGGHPEGVILTPEEMYQWDLKVDDARPATGRVISFKRTSQWNNCATSNTASAAVYNVTYSGTACTVVTKVNP